MLEPSPNDNLPLDMRTLVKRHYKLTCRNTSVDDYDRTMRSNFNSTERESLAVIYQTMRDDGWKPIGLDKHENIKWCKCSQGNDATKEWKLINIKSGYAVYCVRLAEQYNNGDISRKEYDYLSTKEHYNGIKRTDPSEPMIQKLADGVDITSIIRDISGSFKDFSNMET